MSYLQSQEVVDIYAINVSAAQIRHAIRRRFEQNRHITDPRAIDVLLLKGWQEYQETMNLWKQRDHILGILLEDQGASRPPRSFLQKFYEGGCMTWILLRKLQFEHTLTLCLDRQGRGCCTAGSERNILECVLREYNFSSKCFHPALSPRLCDASVSPLCFPVRPFLYYRSVYSVFQNDDSADNNPMAPS
jgi:hypothetical protein